MKHTFVMTQYRLNGSLLNFPKKKNFLLNQESLRDNSLGWGWGGGEGAAGRKETGRWSRGRSHKRIFPIM